MKKHFLNSLILLSIVLFLLSPYVSVNCANKIFVYEESEMDTEREKMIDVIKDYGVTDECVLNAMRKVRRHKFLPAGYETKIAYGDHPLSIGHGQTISQPFIVAYMTEKIAPQNGEKILEIGTGSGYQAAILAEMGARVYSIEIVEPLAIHAQQALEHEGYDVFVKHGDGYKGWEEEAPFSTIIVTCAPEEIPNKLVEQLAEGGKMILPLGSSYFQKVVILQKIDGQITKENYLPVRFVPMVKGEE